MSMKRIIAIFASVLSCSLLQAQMPQLDSLLGRKDSVVDSALVGKTIFDVLPSGVRVIRSASIDSAIVHQTLRNSRRQYSGYRIRLFFDSRQTARSSAEACVTRFKAAFPEIPVYMTFDNPYFNVSAGDYRSKLEAESALRLIKTEFPSAYVVREKMKFPEL